VGPVNVAFQAMENIVPIKAGEEMRRGGIQQAAKFLFRFGLVGFVLLLVAFLVIFLFSRSFLGFVYGPQVAVYSGILNLQLLYFLLGWPLRQLTYLFRTIGRTSVILGGSLVAAIASLALVYPLVRAFGSLGIMLAAVAGQTVSLLFVSIAWVQIKSTYSNESHLQPSPEPPIL
jgi:O-antigen/teichoic acid export membrane protein